MAKSLIGLYVSLVTVLANVSETDSPNVGLTQICIWLPILLVLIVFASVYAMAYMDNGRDSLLYAKFLIADSDRERR
ncbi:hypothetical protein SteCoe_1215 [Stentor coeruleus]|uniref:Uncharacterized protein n=1 Tax=Stentor coeruleus TaxID=5963 RepID=A0A1R2D2H7_9CILI|nr:hypothetical protein SteCoe_1215 [Stentor coeruleus]